MKRAIGDWEELYRDREAESLPWFHRALDRDLAKALRKLGIRSGAVLDLGTGLGTQAMALAKAGYMVTATDISATAVRKAATRAREARVDVEFLEDDILDTKLKGEFDFVFDRGCFHVLQPRKRKEYVTTIGGLIKEGGYLFLKCFSHLETMEGGPYRFKPRDIIRLFSPSFEVVSIDDTVFEGTLDPLPKALFSILRKKP